MKNSLGHRFFSQLRGWYSQFVNVNATRNFTRYYINSTPFRKGDNVIKLYSDIPRSRRKRKWLINDGIERDRFEKSLNEVAVKHRTVLGSPNWLVKGREPSLNLSVRTHRYHYSRPPRQGSLREGSVRRRERWVVQLVGVRQNEERSCCSFLWTSHYCSFTNELETSLVSGRHEATYLR